MAKYTRKIVSIDEDKCDGCGLCVPDCAEGAIQVIDGKARLLAENLCDGLGNCLGVCPRDAITIEDRPADEFDEEAVKARLEQQLASAAPAAVPQGCPGAMLRQLNPAGASAPATDRPSQLRQWPVQLALLPPAGDMWQEADVLIAADCVAFALPDFHERLLAKGKTALAIACPKLDDMGPHVDKLASIFANNDIRSITIAHMEVPCCSGIVFGVRSALERSGRTDIPVTDVTVGIDGRIFDES